MTVLLADLMKKTITVRAPIHQWKALKKYCFKEGITIQEWFTRMIHQTLKPVKK